MRIEQAAIPDESKLVLNALVDFLLAEPVNASLSDVKQLLISKVIEDLIDRQVSIETNDLVNDFIRILDLAPIDEWYLNFLRTSHEGLEIGERLCSITY
ncbi:unnamed protein product [Rotaria magnacalcarata]|uniref:Uncharacterized protein n=1 Tax=Rotaria magnacalcarata TaxID=392030 RepID=A0A816C940_9BILA|nr:unnamed protein product [Rotaria magnacalcarata]CAF1648766.1 unnamed protein product [Rotaria magnacalcarata]CAF2076743.1 unnamed protein product [Rotaria magnacalcarata]CAF2126220.1 unnamed protein product [Rotaria magnacalcarata]CAF2148979.1 unnamed protein product [Rotaria magnacalcarata]